MQPFSASISPRRPILNPGALGLSTGQIKRAVCFLYKSRIDDHCAWNPKLPNVRLMFQYFSASGATSRALLPPTNPPMIRGRSASLRLRAPLESFVTNELLWGISFTLWNHASYALQLNHKIRYSGQSTMKWLPSIKRRNHQIY